MDVGLLFFGEVPFLIADYWKNNELQEETYTDHEGQVKEERFVVLLLSSFVSQFRCYAVKISQWTRKFLQDGALLAAFLQQKEYFLAEIRIIDLL